MSKQLDRARLQRIENKYSTEQGATEAERQEAYDIVQRLLGSLTNLRNESREYLADLNRHQVDTTTLRGAIKQAEDTIAEASKFNF